jgi:hypothetical protein
MLRLTSLLNRIVFFVIPVVVAMIPVIGLARPFYRWLHVRRIDQLHRALGKLERELILAKAQRRPNWLSIRAESRNLNVPYVDSRLRVPSRSIYTGSESICAWFKKTLIEWKR